MPTKTRTSAKRHRAGRYRSTAERVDPLSTTSERRRWIRHLTMALCSAGLVGIFWATRSNWVDEMRLWKAVGDAAYVLLLAALALGPITKLIPSTRSLLRWRRQVGIWFALTATLHAFLILNGWARWSLRRFLGYEFVPQLGREARLEPGFGLANLIGTVALVLALVLAATSSDRALRRLGRPAWTWLHRLTQTILVLTLLHGSYFLFIHFTESFHKTPPPNLDWFRIPFLAAGLAVIALQAIAFFRTITEPPEIAGHR
jgi:sulfoxide reductase heme-binding subunit YedZ